MNRLGAILALLALTGCNYRESKFRPGPFAGSAMGYAQIREQVLAQNCLGCHSGNQAPNLSTYDAVKANLAAIENAVFVKHSMPKRGAMADSDLQALDQWIAAGAPQAGAAPPVETPNPTGQRPAITWAVLKQKLLNGKCLICHYLDNPTKISNLEDIENFKGTIQTTYFLSVLNPAMPPPPKGTPDGDPNPNALSREEKQLLSDWIVDGMQG